MNNALPQINDNRKRMININFIMIVNDMQIKIDYIKNNQITENLLILSQLQEQYIETLTLL